MRFSAAKDIVEEEEEGRVEDPCEVDPGMGGGGGSEVVEVDVSPFP